MTERELRNADWKARTMRDAESHCRLIDLMEEEIKDRERMSAELAAEIDRLRTEQNKAA